MKPNANLALKTINLVALALLLLGSTAGCLWDSRTLPTNTAWVRQFGSSDSDWATGVAADASGNVYVTGVIGIIEDQYASGRGKAFLRKYDGSGNLLWDWQSGNNSSLELAHSVSVDPSGNAFVAGETRAVFPGQVSSGTKDAFVVKLDVSGRLLWARQFGTPKANAAYGASTDASGNVYVVGDLGAAPFIRKYDASGTELWDRRLGQTLAGSAPIGLASGVAVDAAGNAYVVGHTFGSPEPIGDAPSTDGFLEKLDSSGSQVWTRTFRIGRSDVSRAVSLGASGDVFVVGASFPQQGTPLPGYPVASARKFDGSGNLLWSHEYAGTGFTDASGVAAGADGQVYVVGASVSRLAYLKKLGASGNEMWTQSLGSGGTSSAGVALSPASDELYVAGGVSGTLAGSSYGGRSDAFVMKLVGEPRGESKEQWIWTATWVEDLLLGSLVLGLAALGFRIGKKIFRRRRTS